MKKSQFFLALFIGVLFVVGAGCVAIPGAPVRIAEPVSSLPEYFTKYKEKTISQDEFNKKNLTEVVRVFSGNTKKPDYYEIIMTSFYSDTNWHDGKKHHVYIEVSNDDGVAYYGPFDDSLVRLNQELEGWEDEQKITDFDEFSSFEIIK